MADKKYLKLPNADYEIVPHPNGMDKAIEVGLVRDHRFVFYYWYKWWKETKRRLDDNLYKAPSLVGLSPIK